MAHAAIPPDEPLVRRVLQGARERAAMPCGVAAAGAYTLWQLGVEQKGFLHTFLVERVSGSGVPPLPLGYGNVLELKLIMLWRQLCHDPDALQGRQERVYDAVRSRLAALGVVKGPVTGIREYEAGELAPGEFHSEHVRKAVPCVIRGFGPRDLGRLDFAGLARRFPDSKAQAVDTQTGTIASVRLCDLEADRGERYEPLQALLDQDPQLREVFEPDNARRYFRVLGRPMPPIASFLILAIGKGLAAEFHCEESMNWYLAVSGSKRWTLVESEYSWLMYPAALGDGMRRFSLFKPSEDGTPRDRGCFDLFEYVPRVEFDLHPGDVLFFPAWMWHKTVNLDDEGLGVTSRYSLPGPMSNRYFRALQMISPDFLRSIVQVVAAKVRGDTGGLEEVGGFNEQELALR
ncbi:MAG TPA: cupin-like domain-containing protein [Acidimicrobiales bacterium]|nr:cupin-like domain-containing protein [Acidimicrobiales bacterium]